MNLDFFTDLDALVQLGLLFVAAVGVLLVIYYLKIYLSELILKTYNKIKQWRNKWEKLENLFQEIKIPFTNIGLNVIFASATIQFLL